MNADILEPLYMPGEPAVGAHDSLRTYHLDLNNIENTNAADVAHMLKGFDAEVGRREQRANAIATLELTEPFDVAGVGTQYRRLAMRHHPRPGWRRRAPAGDQSGIPDSVSTCRCLKSSLFHWQRMVRGEIGPKAGIVCARAGPPGRTDEPVGDG